MTKLSILVISDELGNTTLDYLFEFTRSIKNNVLVVHTDDLFRLTHLPKARRYVFVGKKQEDIPTRFRSKKALFISESKKDSDLFKGILGWARNSGEAICIGKIGKRMQKHASKISQMEIPREIFEPEDTFEEPSRRWKLQGATPMSGVHTDYNLLIYTKSIYNQ